MRATLCRTRLPRTAATGSNGAVPPDPRGPTTAVPTATDVWDLARRRADLLAARAGDDVLAPITDELVRRLGSAPAAVRRVRRDDPADRALVDELVAGEPVHPFAGPADLADRFAEDRRCLVLEHPLLPGAPMNVVFVALVRGTPSHLADVLDPAAPTLDPAAADTAAFYSIWNVVPGVRGLDGGRQLLEGAVAMLRAELPALRTFVTLSPVPGLRRWADNGGTSEELDADHPDLLRTAARYLTTLVDGRPVDAVAGFHLGNGARLVAVHRHADPSVRGEQRSWGVMANYRYEPEDRPANRAALAAGRPATSDEVAALRGGA